MLRKKNEPFLSLRSAPLHDCYTIVNCATIGAHCNDSNNETFPRAKNCIDFPASNRSGIKLHIIVRTINCYLDHNGNKIIYRLWIEKIRSSFSLDDFFRYSIFILPLEEHQFCPIIVRTSWSRFSSSLTFGEFSSTKENVFTRVCFDNSSLNLI